MLDSHEPGLSVIPAQSSSSTLLLNSQPQVAYSQKAGNAAKSNVPDTQHNKTLEIQMHPNMVARVYTTHAALAQCL